MNLLHLDSIAGRTMIVLLVGLTLSHIASTAMLASDRHDAVVTVSERLAADQVGVVARALDHAPAADRSRLAADLDSPILAISLGAEPATAAVHTDDADELRQLEGAFRTTLGDVDGERLHAVQRTFTTPTHSFWDRLLQGFPEDRVTAVSFRLSDGSWANFTMTTAQAAALWSQNFLASALVMLVGIVVLGVWATGWVARPLAAFVGAADRLGRDVHAPPLAEAGPREVRHAVAAFNDMQGRIQRFVDDRTRMLAAISHDLRSPITRLRLRAELLPASEGRERMLADLAEMEGMVASTLDFARGEATDELGQAIDLAATLEAICDNTSDMGFAAAYQWESRVVCACRPAALKRALANLVENAARYGGGAEVRAHHRGDRIEIVIEDEGPGIPEPEMDKVFSPFYRLETSRNRKTGGIGLGMTVARSIIRSHGGDITLKNRPEGGLRVTVTLPQESPE